MEKKDIIEDALQLCLEILKDEKPKRMNKLQEMFISVEEVPVQMRIEWHWYYYKKALTPNFLVQESIIEILPDDDPELEKIFLRDRLEWPSLQGFYSIKVDLQKVHQWVENVTNASLSSVSTSLKAEYQKTGDNRGKLFVGNEEIDELKRNQAALCEIIFHNQQSRKKEWSAGDILEKWGEDSTTMHESSVYSAAHEIREKVAKKLKREEKFFITTRRSVKLNPKFF